MEGYKHGIFKSDEKKDSDYFKKFAETAKRFSQFKETEYATFYDIIAWNLSGGTEAVELKTRGKGTDKFKDCFIEPEKFGDLKNLWLWYRTLPLYINFIGDWKNVYIWVLPQLQNTLNFYPSVLIDGKWESRIGLRWDEAYHYVYDEDSGEYIIHKPKKGTLRKLEYEVFKSDYNQVINNKIDKTTIPQIWKNRKQE